MFIGDHQHTSTRAEQLLARLAVQQPLDSAVDHERTHTERPHDLRIAVRGVRRSGRPHRDRVAQRRRRHRDAHGTCTDPVQRMLGQVDEDRTALAFRQDADEVTFCDTRQPEEVLEARNPLRFQNLDHPNTSIIRDLLRNGRAP